MRKVISNKSRQERRFRQIFIDLVHDNMAIEDEAVFSKKDIARRYKLLIDGLIRDGIHKKIVFPEIRHGKN